MEPPREDGRRCLHAFELEEMGWRTDGHDRLFDPAGSQRAGGRFPKAA